ncbi:MAG: TIGR02281 family clan AA aspartic protease [Erythrobacter sp.]
MFSYLSHLGMIGATMMGGFFLLSGNVSEQIFDGLQAHDAQIGRMHTSAKVFAPEVIEDGRYYASVGIGAKTIRFMIDTGASQTVLSAADAKLLGFRKLGTVKVDTLGGEVDMLKGRVPSMTIGDVTLSEVDVLVAETVTVSLIGVDTLHRLGATHLSLQLS